MYKMNLEHHIQKAKNQRLLESCQKDKNRNKTLEPIWRGSHWLKMEQSERIISAMDWNIKFKPMSS